MAFTTNPTPSSVSSLTDPRPAISHLIACTDGSLYAPSVYAHSASSAARTGLAVKVLRKHSIDLLVVGAYGHSPIRQFILGSTTTTMVRTRAVPVLMFR